jgi:hypothetical protein
LSIRIVGHFKDPVEEAQIAEIIRQTNSHMTTVPAQAVNADMLDGLHAADYCFNVKAFGAKGDGVSDDTSAIQAALDNAGEKGGTVFLPAGSYNATGIHVHSHTVLKGTGFCSELQLHNSSSNHVVYLDDATVSDVTVRDLKINGDRYNNTTSSSWNAITNGNGIYCVGGATYRSVNNIRIDNVELANCNNGLYGDYWSQFNMSGLYVHNSAQTGINVPELSVLSDSHFYANGDADWYWVGCHIRTVGWFSRILNNFCEYGFYGLKNEWSSECLISRNYFMYQGNQSILVRGNSAGLEIKDNFLLESSNGGNYSAIGFSGGTNAGAKSCSITDNTFGVYERTNGWKYCIEEDQYCDDNYFANNYYRYGYNQTDPVLVYGTNTVSKFDIK